MGPRGPSPDIGWLVHQRNGEAILAVAERMTVDDSHWQAVIERIDASPGIRVYLTRAVVHQPLSVEAAQLSDDNWLYAQMSVRGRLSIRFTDGLLADVTPDRGAIFRPHQRRAELTPFPGRSLRLVGYMVRQDRLRGMFGDTLPEPLSRIMDEAAGESALVPVQTGSAMRRLAAALFATPLNGPLRAMFFEGAVHQFLAIKMSSALPPVAILGAGERRRLRRARDRLLADMRNPPGIAELASAAGMSEAAFNAGFRTLFGATAYELLRDQRLDHARIALETTTLPVKQIAHGVGYNHVTNFINAFTRRYGAPPRRYIRDHAGPAT